MSRLVGEPETFSTDKAAFPKWSCVMASYISAMSNEMGRLMGEAGDQSDRITLVGLTADSRPCAAQLFRVLTMLCKDEALEAIMGVVDGDAWRQLKRDSRPRIHAANRCRLPDHEAMTHP